MNGDAQRWDSLIGVIFGASLAGIFAIVQTMWRDRRDGRRARTELLEHLGDEFLDALSIYLVTISDSKTFTDKQGVSADYRHEALRAIRRDGNKALTRMHVLMARAEVLWALPLRDGMMTALTQAVDDAHDDITQDASSTAAEGPYAPFIHPDAARAVVAGVEASYPWSLTRWWRTRGLNRSPIPRDPQAATRRL